MYAGHESVCCRRRGRSWPRYSSAGKFTPTAEVRQGDDALNGSSRQGCDREGAPASFTLVSSSLKCCMGSAHAVLMGRIRAVGERDPRRAKGLATARQRASLGAASHCSQKGHGTLLRHPCEATACFWFALRVCSLGPSPTCVHPIRTAGPVASVCLKSGLSTSDLT